MNIFTNQSLDKIKKSIPDNIMNLGIKFINESEGFVRFDDNKISSIYIRCQIPNCDYCLLKFKYLDEDYIFKYIYLTYDKYKWYNPKEPISLINPNRNQYYEYRYDRNLNLESTYIWNKLPKKYKHKKRILINKKGTDSYWVNTHKKTFTDKIKLVNDENIFKVNFDVNKKMKYITRDEKNSIYIQFSDMK